MFKYIKKLTSVVVMFAVIIVFSSSKVYAGSAFSVPPNVEKATEVVGIVNDIATLTGIGLKSKQDVNVPRSGDKVKADKVKIKKLSVELNTKVINILTVAAINHFFSPTDSKKLDTILTSTIVGIPSVPEKNIGLKIEHYKTDANKISPFNVVGISGYLINGGVSNGFLGFYNGDITSPTNLAGITYPASSTILVSTEIKVPKSNNLQPACLAVCELLATNGRYYEGIQEADGSWVYSVAGLKKLTMDMEEFRKSADNSSGNSGSGTSGGCGSECM